MESFTFLELDNDSVELLYNFLEKNKEFSDTFYPHPFDLQHLQSIIEKKQKDFYCIALLYGVPVAYGILRGWDDGYEIPSLGVAVDSDFRSLGIGLFVCQYLHMVAKLRGSNIVRLKVVKTNYKARKLYEKLGYTFSEYNDNYLEGFLELK